MTEDPAAYHLAIQTNEIAEMKSKRNNSENEIAGIKLTVTPNVYPGGLDSKLMCQVMKILPKDHVLDLCTGSGIIALKAASIGAKNVIGTDLNPAAITSANLNKSKLGLTNIEFKEGNLFEPVDGQKFDVITINPPYTSKKPIDKTEICFWDEDNKTTKKFFKEVRNYIKPGGRVYFAWADFATIPNLPVSLAKSERFTATKLIEQKHKSGLSTFMVYQIGGV